MVGLSDNWSGVIQDTASTSTLVALICARERTTEYSLASGGLQAQGKPLVIYVSEYAHSSVDKAALLAGFGKDNIRHIACDDSLAMDPIALQAAIEQDLAAGLVPCAITATVGTTTTTAVDPLTPVAAIARRFNLWLHVDSAMAGSAMILPECRWMWAGIEQADSIVVNAHKWLGVAFDCSLYFVKDSQHLIRVMSTNPSYLQTSVDSQVKNLRDWGIPLGRRFRALKLWFRCAAKAWKACNNACAATWPMPNGSSNRSSRQVTGKSSPRSICKPCAFAMNRRAWRVQNWMPTPRPGPAGSINQAWPMSRRRRCRAAGWCACPSAH